MRTDKNLHRQFLTKGGYRKLVTKAKEFRDALMRDSGYTNPSANHIALESMLIGWLRSTPEWKAYDKHCAEHFPRTDLYTIAQDQAVQAAHDALMNDGFDGVTWFFSVKELNAMIDQTPPMAKTRLAAKVAKAKKRLGIDFNESPKGRRIQREIAEAKAKLGYKPRK